MGVNAPQEDGKRVVGSFVSVSEPSFRPHFPRQDIVQPL